MGNAAEDLAAAFLLERGYRVLERQYVALGAEVDIIALDRRELVFVEVKSRTSDDFGFPEEAVTAAKLRKIARVAEWYCRVKGLDVAWRVDVLAVRLACDPPEIHHVQGVGG